MADLSLSLIFFTLGCLAMLGLLWIGLDNGFLNPLMRKMGYKKTMKRQKGKQLLTPPIPATTTAAVGIRAIDHQTQPSPSTSSPSSVLALTLEDLNDITTIRRRPNGGNPLEALASETKNT